MDLLAAHSSSHPERVALLHGGRELSYGELASEVSRLASGLRETFAAGELLAIWLPNGPELLCLVLACLRAGVVPMPLHRGMTWPEVRRILEYSRARSLVTSRRLIEPGATDPAVAGLDRIHVVDADGPPRGLRSYAELLGRERVLDPCPLPAEEVCLVLHTSGSNGRPKGVMLSRRSIEHILDYRLAHTALDLHSVSVVASCLTQSMGLYQSLALLAAGGTLVVLESYDVDELVESIHRYRPTHLIMVVDAFDRLLHDPRITERSLRSLVFASVGADRVTPRVQGRFIALTGRPLRATYGLTESSWALVNPGDRIDKCLALGKPCPGVAVRLSSPEGREVSPGQVGEIHIRSPRNMLGYLGDERLTHESLVQGWLASGDLAYRDHEGWFWFAGRTKNLIVLPSGDNVSPVEVADALLHHPGVSACVVVGVETPEAGEGPWAFVVRRDEGLSEATTLAFLRERLSEYKIPRRVVFLRELPVGLTGKVHGDEVRRLAAR